MFDVQEIPLSKLILSSANVRNGTKAENVKELAASIKAHGLLQNLTVRKGTGETKGQYEVVAGRRRLTALQRLAEKQEIAANTRIPCHVLNGEIAEEISLAENVGQCPMHPAEQYTAFAKLHTEQNMPPEDIAAHFGVSATVVRQRLKLGSVSPKLIKRYRDGEMSLDQLMGFTITDDHKKQERVWKELPSFNNSRSAILDALTEDQVPGDDRRARLIGAEAYEQAGGTIIRDLFDTDGTGYFADAELLNRLVREKLQRAAKKVVGEGWKWVSVEPDFDHEAAMDMRRVHPHLSDEDQKQMWALENARDSLYETVDQEEEDAPDQLKAIEDEMEALAEHERYLPEDIARAGVFVCLGPDGHPRIERGYLRKEDEAAEEPAADQKTEGQQQEAKPKLLSDKLATELTAARTSALRSVLGSDPAVALTAVVHALALRLFFQTPEGSCLQLSAREAALPMHPTQIADCLSEHEVAERHYAWRKRLPEDTEGLWGFIAGLTEPERMKLLAHCAALTVDAVQHSKEGCAPADVLASAVKLDMVRYWQPSADNYFGRVSRERIVEALREVGGAEVPHPILAMKKQPMAEAAQTFVTGKGWLPAVLRTP